MIPHRVTIRHRTETTGTPGIFIGRLDRDEGKKPIHGTVLTTATQVLLVDDTEGAPTISRAGGEVRIDGLLTRTLTEPEEIRFGLAYAVTRGLEATFVYTKPGKPPAQRRVAKLTPRPDGMAIVCTDIDKNAVRAFMLDRITDLQLRRVERGG